VSGDLRPRPEEDDAAARVVRPVRRPARASSGYYGSGVPISNGYYYYWADYNGDHLVQRDEILFDYGVYGFYNDIDPATLPERARTSSTRL
jgi:hypothetical protein